MDPEIRDDDEAGETLNMMGASVSWKARTGAHSTHRALKRYLDARTYLQACIVTIAMNTVEVLYVRSGPFARSTRNPRGVSRSHFSKSQRETDMWKEPLWLSSDEH